MEENDDKLEKDLMKIKNGDHILLLSEEETDMVLPIITYLKTSLNRKEKCIYITGDTKLEGLISGLHNNIDNFASYIEKGQIQVLDKNETYFLDNNFDPDKMIDFLQEECNKALKQGYSALNVSGDISWLLNFSTAKRDIVEYESKLNEVIFSKYPIIALCRYNINKFDEETVKNIIELHPYIIWQNQIHENPYHITYEGYKDNSKIWLENIVTYNGIKSRFGKEIKQEEKRYEFLFNKISDAIYLSQINNFGFTKFEKVNDGACNMLNYTRKELLNMTALDIDLNMKKMMEAFPAELFDNNSFSKFISVSDMRFETIHVSKDGDHIPVEVQSHSYQKNNKQYMLSIVRDITKRKNSEKDLLEKDKRLQESYENLEAHNEEITAINEELESSYQELDKLTIDLENMISLISNLTRRDNEENFLSDILKAAMKIIPEADFGKVYLYENNNIVFIDAIGHDINSLKKLCLKTEYIKDFDRTEAKVVNEHSILDLDKTPKDLIKEYHKVNKKINQSLFINLKVKDEIVGRISLETAEYNTEGFKQNSIRLLKSLECIASSHLTLQRYNKLQENFIKELLLSITNILEMYDKYTSGHSVNVAELSAKIAKRMGMNKQEIVDIYWAGMVHDIGKLLVSLDIINKKGKLTEEEYEIIKKHPIWGYKALNKSDFLNHIPNYVLYHHERWDGKGYPKGLKANEIPMAAQILSVADAWDAMISKRAYRDAMNKEEALEEILKNKGVQFSPEVVEVFIELINSN
ncbi:HD domain-containing phosphohydrolase [Natronospora cellulosivora (SeqCode)]